jgi:Transmembrane protein 231
LGENAFENSEKMILCSSYAFLNQFNETSIKCSKFKFSEKDENFDGKSDEMNFSFHMHTIYAYGLRSISIVLFLDTRVTDQCSFHVPSAIIINKKIFANNFSDRKIFISGSLQAAQVQSLKCPFFMRNRKSHFFFDQNHKTKTNLDEFHPSKIRENLERNPLHFNFQESSTDLQHVDRDETTISIRMRIPSVSIRYQKSFWKTVNDLWINYIAIFSVTFLAANLTLNKLFDSRWLMARKERYVKKDD